MNTEDNGKVYFFSYGSLKQGFMNHYILQNDKFIAEAITVDKYNMYPALSFRYPYAIANEKNGNCMVNYLS